jgi:hypothetical protein
MHGPRFSQVDITQRRLTGASTAGIGRWPAGKKQKTLARRWRARVAETKRGGLQRELVPLEPVSVDEDPVDGLEEPERLEPVLGDELLLPLWLDEPGVIPLELWPLPDDELPLWLPLLFVEPGEPLWLPPEDPSLHPVMQVINPAARPANAICLRFMGSPVQARLRWLDGARCYS